MRRLPLLTLLALVLAAPAFAVPGSGKDGTLSVKRGRGFVQLSFDGAVLGHIAKGRVTISDPINGDGQGADFWGCERKRTPTDTMTTCSGEDIRFRAIGGKYRISVRGGGVFLSAVGEGKVVLDGRGDEIDGPDGVYSLNGDDYQSLPDEAKIFDLGAPNGG